MIERIAWPGPPFRLSGMIGCLGWYLRVCALLLGVMGIALAAFAAVLASDRAGPWLGVFSDEAGPGYWFAVLALAAIGIGVAWFGRAVWAKAGQQARMARGSDEARLVAADLIARISLEGGGVSWRYAYDWQGRRWHAGQLFAVDPLILDDVASRGVALVMPDGAAQLLAMNAFPLAMDKARRRRLLAEIAAVAAERTPADIVALNRLEAQLTGKRRDFVRYYRQACHTDDPDERRRLGFARAVAGGGLGGDEADALLQDCRRHAAGGRRLIV